MFARRRFGNGLYFTLIERRRMLTLTPTANEAVEAIVSQMGEGENAGLRISSAGTREDGPTANVSLELAVVAEPDPGDATIEGAPIYVEQETAEFLAGKVLDADIAEEQIRFSLYDEPSEPTA
jgi:Fe-S cluster assembly iron-binding protein IscA